MTKRAAPRRKKTAADAAAAAGGPLRRGLRAAGRGLALAGAMLVLLVALFSFVNPPRGIYMLSETWRLGGIERDWVPIGDMAPAMARSVVAAEDANFCLHWGFDMAEIRRALKAGENRGASTITQQVVKNVFLWQGRSWARKAMEAVLTPVVELFWSKRRIVEVYLNVAEMGEGVFGAEAAARYYFGVSARDLSPAQAARLAAVLPDPKDRNPATPSGFLRRRAAQIASGAETIAADGRAACFEGP
ncbi:MAG: monofunctional biosynthetic peptidoglycan transglycosylase [Pseudomonadota bacterium]